VWYYREVPPGVSIKIISMTEEVDDNFPHFIL
jgi:hypothetical protein